MLISVQKNCKNTHQNVTPQEIYLVNVNDHYHKKLQIHYNKSLTNLRQVLRRRYPLLKTLDINSSRADRHILQL